MTDQRLLDYINSQKRGGTSDEIIKTSLVNTGWDQSHIDEAFQNINNNSTQLNTNNSITDKEYPIQNKLIYKQIFSYIPFAILFLLVFFRVGTNAIDFLIYLPIIFITLIIMYLKKKYYHYELQDKYIVLHQGILNKQQRTLQYGVIQNVLVKQGFLDRIFGIATLILENAAGKGSQGVTKAFGIRFKTNQQKKDLIGFRGNKVSIPGLDKSDAENLKAILLQKIQENPIEDKQSGL